MEVFPIIVRHVCYFIWVVMSILLSKNTQKRFFLYVTFGITLVKEELTSEKSIDKSNRRFHHHEHFSFFIRRRVRRRRSCCGCRWYTRGSRTRCSGCKREPGGRGSWRRYAGNRRRSSRGWRDYWTRRDSPVKVGHWDRHTRPAARTLLPIFSVCPFTLRRQWHNFQYFGVVQCWHHKCVLWCQMEVFTRQWHF